MQFDLILAVCYGDLDWTQLYTVLISHKFFKVARNVLPHLVDHYGICMQEHLGIIEGLQRAWEMGRNESFFIV